MSSQVVNVLRREQQSILSRRSKLDSERKQLDTDLQLIDQVLRRRQATAPRPAAIKRAAPRVISKKTKRSPGLSTMEMVRQVLNNSFSSNPGDPELTHEQVSKAIRDTYGNVRIADSMPQMLYKRAHANNTFYRTKEGRYGMLAWRATQRAA